ncbi:MAG: hypothetical protein JSW10_10515 [Pseudomonadota bacterium]|nr:MAG: hypothetical protein JSW10_10515 [Pseudomonadota bacterium]
MRIVGLVLLVVGGAFVFGSGTTWVQLVAGMALILGFMLFSLDLMRRSIEKRG